MERDQIRGHGNCKERARQGKLNGKVENVIEGRNDRKKQMMDDQNRTG